MVLGHITAGLKSMPIGTNDVVWYCFDVDVLLNYLHRGITCMGHILELNIH